MTPPPRSATGLRLHHRQREAHRPTRTDKKRVPSWLRRGLPGRVHKYSEQLGVETPGGCAPTAAVHAVSYPGRELLKLRRRSRPRAHSPCSASNDVAGRPAPRPQEFSGSAWLVDNEKSEFAVPNHFPSPWAFAGRAPCRRPLCPRGRPRPRRRPPSAGCRRHRRTPLRRGPWELYRRGRPGSVLRSPARRPPGVSRGVESGWARRTPLLVVDRPADPLNSWGRGAATPRHIITGRTRAVRLAVGGAAAIFSNYSGQGRRVRLTA